MANASIAVCRPPCPVSLAESSSNLVQISVSPWSAALIFGSHLSQSTMWGSPLLVLLVVVPQEREGGRQGHDGADRPGREGQQTARDCCQDLDEALRRRIELLEVGDEIHDRCREMDHELADLHRRVRDPARVLDDPVGDVIDTATDFVEER